MLDEDEGGWGCIIIVVVFILCVTAYEISKLFVVRGN